MWLLLAVRKRMQEEVMSTVIFLGIGFKVFELLWLVKKGQKEEV